MFDADRRIHGTTHEQPAERFERGGRTTLLPLPTTAMPVRDRRVKRRVSTDCFVDVDTIRYSVPHGLVKRAVEVLVGDTEVVVFDGRVEVARHRRHFEPFQRVSDRRHSEEIFRQRETATVIASSPIGRSLAVYAAAAGGGA